MSRAENNNINERLVCKKGTDLDFKQNDKLSFGKNETPFKRMEQNSQNSRLVQTECLLVWQFFARARPRFFLLKNVYFTYEKYSAK